MNIEENFVVVKNMFKQYQDVNVLSGINFEIKKGTIFCLLGSNGAGKSTTVNILSTLLKADGGTAYINGYKLQKDSDKIRKIISLTGQYSAVDGFLTGYENLMLIANLRHVKNPKNIVEELLKQFGLKDVANKRADTYSGGMRRKLDIAMSLIGDPQLIFLDEPTTGLDPQSRIRMWELIKGLKEQGTTIFLTTQYIEEAEQLADTIAILNKGNITAKGTVSELHELYPQAGTLEEIFLTIVKNEELKTI